MEDSEVIRYLNALYVRTLVQECQITALRLTLKKAGLIDDAAVEKRISECVDIHAEILSGGKSEEERYAAILRSFEGPVQ